MGWFYSQLFVTPHYPTKKFTGQTVIVTGSNVGLGLEAARHFARLDASKVILAVRNISAGEKAKKSIEESENRPGVCEVWKLDLASYESVKDFGDRAATLPRLDVVVENAAIATTDFNLSEGHERSITVNVISTILLGLLLLPKLKKTAKDFPASQPHLSIVTSEVHAWTGFAEWEAVDTFAALDESTSANMVERYCTSKLLEILAIREISQHLSGPGVVINMVNPGLCHSELARESGWGLAILKFFFARSTEVGSRTLLAGATTGPESHGAYMSDAKVANHALSPFVQSSDGLKAQRKVWMELSQIIEGVKPGVTNEI